VPAVLAAAANAASVPAALAAAALVAAANAVSVLAAPAVGASAASVPAALAAAPAAAAAVVVNAVSVPAAPAVGANAASVPAALVNKMQERLKLSDDLFYAEKADKHLFLNPSIPDWLVVNSNGGLLLSKCNGLMSQEEIATSCGAPLHDVEMLFERAIEHGIIDTNSNTARQCGFDDKILIPGESSKSALPTLRIVHFKLTDDCNLRCRYCYAKSGGMSDSLSLAELTRVTDEISEISSAVECVLSGGEPLLHPHALVFAELLKSRGHGISLLTNGTLVNAGNAARIVAFSDRIKISLDGSTDDIHSMTRNRRNHATIVAAIDLLVELGANVQVAMTVHRGNRHNIDAMARRYGSMLTFQPLFPAGRGAERNDLYISGSEYYEALTSVENVAPMAAISSILERLRGRGIKRCALAEAEISISETGDVYPCQLLTDSEFVAGNIRDSSLKEIYYHSPVLAKARAVSVDTLDTRLVSQATMAAKYKSPLLSNRAQWRGRSAMATRPSYGTLLSVW